LLPCLKAESGGTFPGKIGQDFPLIIEFQKDALQGGLGRAGQNAAIPVVAASVAGAFKSILSLIPMDPATEMGTFPPQGMETGMITNQIDPVFFQHIDFLKIVPVTEKKTL